MKCRTVEVCEGEWLGPVDWSYDFSQHAWGPTSGGVNPECIEEGRRVLLAMGADPVGWTHRGFEVVAVGMYDGWPYWKPTPTIGYIGPLGFERATFWCLSPHDTRGKP